MGFFSRREDYDRARILDAAARARARGRRGRAIALYRRVLAVEPQNADLHHRLAPLLAETGRRFDAWIHYRTAARGYAREERLEKAHAVYQEATRRLPRNFDAWLERAEFERRRGQRDEALGSLLEARAQFRGRRRRPQAIQLLRRARSLEPQRLDVLLDLVSLLARTDQKPEALLLLERAEKGAKGVPLRRLRAARFRTTRRLGDLWRLLRTPVPAAGAARLRPHDGGASG